MPNSEQINHPSLNHIYTKLMPNHIHHHYAPSVTSTHTTHIISQLHPHTHHIVTDGFWDRPCRSDCTAGQMDGEAGWWTTSGNIGLSPLARVMGVGRQQHHHPETEKHNIHHIPYSNILQHSKAKNTIFNNGHYTTNIYLMLNYLIYQHV